MSRKAATWAIVLLAAAACTSEADSPTTTAASPCSEPPAGALVFESQFEISLDPGTVDAGGISTLSVEFEGQPPSDYVGGAGMSWECWAGDAWVETHILVRAFNESARPTVVDLAVDSDIAIPDIGLNVPNAYDVLIPHVAPGTYRITDRIFGPNTTLTAHVVVEVRE